MAKRVVDLGLANGWNVIPAEIQNAEFLGYRFVCVRHTDTGYSEYRCETPEAIITYNIDSSD